MIALIWISGLRRVSWKSELLRAGRQATATVIEVHDGSGDHADDAVAVGVVDGERSFAIWIHHVARVDRYRVGDQVQVWYDPFRPERIRTEWDANDGQWDELWGFPAVVIGIVFPFVARDAIWATVAARRLRGTAAFEVQIETGFARPRFRRSDLVVVRSAAGSRPYRIVWRPGLPGPAHVLGPNGANVVVIIEADGSTRLARHALLRQTEVSWIALLDDLPAVPTGAKTRRRPMSKRKSGGSAP